MSVNSPYYNDPSLTAPVAEQGVVESTTTLARISWGAVISGVVLAIGIQILFSMLGAGIGLSTLDPVQGDSPNAETIGLSAWIWWTVTNLIAMFVGGWVAGYLAGIPRRLDGSLHGILTWSLATILALAVLGTALGSLLSGTANMVESGIRMVAPQVGDFAKNSNINWGRLSSDARDLLAGRSTNSQGLNDDELNSMLSRLFRNGKVAPGERDRIVTLLDERTDLSREDADKVVRQWETMYQRLIGENGQNAKETADRAARVVSKASLWGFVALLISAIAAAVGGMFGVPQRILSNAIRSALPSASARVNPNLRVPPTTPQPR